MAQLASESIPKFSSQSVMEKSGVWQYYTITSYSKMEAIRVKGEGEGSSPLIPDTSSSGVYATYISDLPFSTP